MSVPSWSVEEAGVAVAVLVEDLKLRAGVRALPPADQPGAFRPPGQIQILGQLRDPRAVAVVAVGVDRVRPRGFGEFEDRLADRVAQLVTDRETNRGVTAILRERVRLTAFRTRCVVVSNARAPNSRSWPW